MHGSTPLSQIGAVPSVPHVNVNVNVDSNRVQAIGNYKFICHTCFYCKIFSVIYEFFFLLAPRPSLINSDDDDDIMSKKKQKRGVLPKHATSIMRSWLFQHIVVT